jgi:hypothetical protein
MEDQGPRSGPQRKRDVLDKLQAPNADVWVASASTAGVAHLVPLSLAWDGERLMLALERAAVTARNITASGQARLALGATRDVVVIDATLETVADVGQAPADIGDTYAAQADWDPRPLDGYVFLVLRPWRIQAWREADEIAGRTVMRDGTWLY